MIKVIFHYTHRQLNDFIPARLTVIFIMNHRVPNKKKKYDIGMSIFYIIK